MRAASKIIPLANGYHVWTRRIGDSPIKLLILHGGPGFNHEYLLPFQDVLPEHEIEIYFYDQLGSYNSDQPDDPSLWTVERFRRELEEVRQHLELDQFYLLGQSWGGMLAMEYALHYPGHLKGLIISNMTASIASYVKYVNELREQAPPDVVSKMKAYEANEDYENEEYQALLMEHLYKKHICRLEEWPETLQTAFSHANMQVYNTMQGPNEFLVTGNFRDWDKWDDIHLISAPTKLLVGRHDSMSPADIEEMGRRIPNAQVTICENGSHLSIWDDPQTYFDAIIDFINQVEGRKE